MDPRYQFFDHLVYRSLGSRRFTQSSPILPDVWIRFGLFPDERLPLLLTPDRHSSTGDLARSLRHALKRFDPDDPQRVLEARVAASQTVVAADLYFHELIRAVLPLSVWWRDYLNLGAGQNVVGLFINQRDVVRERLQNAWSTPNYTPKTLQDPTIHLAWLARVVGTISLLSKKPHLRELLEPGFHLEPAQIADEVVEVFGDVVVPEEDAEPTLWRVNQNRTTLAGLVESTTAVKADAAHRVFDVKGRGITWAVIDTGIDARHLAFRKRDKEGKVLDEPFPRHPRTKRVKNNTRVKATYDFIRIRDLLSGDTSGLPSVEEFPQEQRDRIVEERDELKKMVLRGKVVSWDLMGSVLRIPHRDDAYKPPKHPHGTHVAGIIGADWRPEDDPDDEIHRVEDRMSGIAPEVELIDIRVLDDDGKTDEFSLMAGMQFVRHLNTCHDERQVHGVNLSFSLRHNFSVFACGRTPVCLEAERLTGNGAVVVAAAGNEGMARFQVLDDATSYHIAEGNRQISITDPGNAEAVITVGATHRRDPHTYGVSYFSSRGPTGDGRRKPDLVAPGEKIVSTYPNDEQGEMDGTSQAAPHVSGAAALLLDRNPELIGQPDFVKKILCESATDLGRERYFQGAGMLDILRALQSI